ncbi:helix-turn-helix domain-containing protein [Desulfoscipio geothermicus]|uniref:Transcriptional regulator, contains XRE-family HTH domain n=1 Tax=Desulfoscipio geothermicus DSM 3669 TaxID=1121426 RepID=A0A1I6E3L0_9FIRM|nr:helix-turn-helix transcriptional regulator [Desulfoscipio geothermicus]SFR12360.1 Transcriptional regulator, contains XRE-family HTH domain [Desulfoscipio geothermicus DSM 3669]
MEIGSRIKIFREAAKVKSYELAQAVGVSKVYMSKLERNAKKPSIETIERICSTLGITLGEFFADDIQEVSPEIKQIINKAQKLTPRQLKILNDVLDEWIDNKKDCT